MARHTHRFVARAITGQNAANGKESLLGWRAECEHCGKLAKTGNTIEEIKKSQLGEIVTENRLVSIEYK